MIIGENIFEIPEIGSEIKLNENFNKNILVPSHYNNIPINSTFIDNNDIIKCFSNVITEKNNTLEIDDITYENLYFINQYQFIDKKNESTLSTDVKLKSDENLLSKKRDNNKKNKRKKEHSKFEKDNVMRKLNIHFISFIVKFVNYNIKRLISKNHPLFTNLCYEFKKRINNTSFNELKNKTIGELLKNEGSIKNKRNIIYPKNENEKIYNSLYETSLRDLLDVNYIQFFRNVYTYNPYKGHNLSDYFNKYKAPKNIIFFDDFLNNEEKKDKINGELYKKRLLYISKSEFISEGYPFFETKTICDKKK